MPVFHIRQSFCTVSTSSNVDCSNIGCTTEKKYEDYIQGGANWHCSSCHRLLFENQIKYIAAKQITDLTRSVGIASDSVVCCTCYSYFSKKQVPAICSSLNDLLK